APIAGILFAIEVLLVDVSLSSIIPLVVASVAGSLCSIVLQQNEILFEFSRIPSFDFHNVPFYFGLGLVCAMVSLLYLATIQKLQNVFKAFHPILRWGIASIGMFGIVALVAPVRGEGYSVIQLLGQGRADMVPGNLPFSMEPRGYLLAFFIVMILAKILATALTLRSGGIGGSFAPSLFIGACTGFVLARGLNLLHPEFLPESNFTIVGMAGMLSGIMYAPLTGVFLIAEATGGYNLIVPLLLVSAVTHLIVIQFLPHSIESTEMTAQGVAPTQRRDVQILGEMQVKNLVETDFASLPHNGFLGDLVAAVARSKRSLFPVLADGQKLAGIVNLNDVTGIIFRTELYETVTIASIMIQPPATIDLHENMRDAMERFDQTGAWNLPVIESGKYKGFVSRSRIFQAYRHELKNA
ncbi:MAG: chloride channel protein, partial [Spirochaetia bacterium]|nr:chloride channel protein [Spirochaetia bacterium]